MGFSTWCVCTSHSGELVTLAQFIDNVMVGRPVRVHTKGHTHDPTACWSVTIFFPLVSELISSHGKVCLVTLGRLEVLLLCYLLLVHVCLLPETDPFPCACGGVKLHANTTHQTTTGPKNSVETAT